jgi:hypothetical protein
MKKATNNMSNQIHELPPSEMNKELTSLLIENMNSSGFMKKKTGSFWRKENDCEQYFSFSFTRDRGLPGNNYSMYPTLSFRYQKVDELQCLFMGKEYDNRERKFGTGSRVLYTLVPEGDSFRYKYCMETPMNDHAELIYKDFSDYALPFYDKYDSLDKLETYFDQNKMHNPDGFSVIRHNAYGCCIAAVLCANGKLKKCLKLLEDGSIITDEQKARILEYIKLQ